jgi:hypothetical protein
MRRPEGGGTTKRAGSSNFPASATDGAVVANLKRHACQAWKPAATKEFVDSSTGLEMKI